MSDTNPVEGVSAEITPAETPTIVPAETEQPAPSIAPTPRDLAEQRAADKLKQIRAAQAPETTEAPAETAEAAEQRARDEKGRFAPKDATAEPTASTQQTDEPKYKVKVNGQEREIPLSELLRGYGTNEAATQRFQEAARLRQEAEERLRQQVAQAQPAATPAAPAEPEVFDPVVRIKTAEGATYERPYSDVMAYGTPEEIRQAETQKLAVIVERVKSAQAQGPTIDQIQQVVRYSNVRATEEQILRHALTEHAAIVSDPRLATVAHQTATRLMAEDLVNLVPEYGPQIRALPPQAIADRHQQARFSGYQVRPIGEILSTAAKETADWFGARPTASAAPPDAFKAKVDAKRAAPQPIQGTGARQAPTTDATRPKTRSEIIEAERRARGFTP